MKKYVKEGKKVKFANDLEMEAVREEEKCRELGEDLFNEAQYNAFMKAKSKDPRFYVPELDSETLRQVRELEKKEAAINDRLRNMKLVEGVDTVEYDELGRAKGKTKGETKIVIVPDTGEDKPTTLIDEDKEYEELSEEEKEIRDCLNKEEDEGDLEDNFVLLANGGVPALIPIEPETNAIEEELEEEPEEEDMNPVDNDIDNEQLDAMVNEYLKKKKEKAKEPVIVKPLPPPENLLPEEMRCEHKEIEISSEEHEKIKGILLHEPTSIHNGVCGERRTRSFQ